MVIFPFTFPHHACMSHEMYYSMNLSPIFKPFLHHPHPSLDPSLPPLITLQPNPFFPSIYPLHLLGPLSPSLSPLFQTYLLGPLVLMLYLGPLTLSTHSPQHPQHPLSLLLQPLEYKALAHATYEILWLQTLLSKLGVFLTQPHTL